MYVLQIAPKDSTNVWNFLQTALKLRGIASKYRLVLQDILSLPLYTHSLICKASIQNRYWSILSLWRASHIRHPRIYPSCGSPVLPVLLLTVLSVWYFLRISCHTLWFLLSERFCPKDCRSLESVHSEHSLVHTGFPCLQSVMLSYHINKKCRPLWKRLVYVLIGLYLM